MCVRVCVCDNLDFLLKSFQRLMFYLYLLIQHKVITFIHIRFNFNTFIKAIVIVFLFNESLCKLILYVLNIFLCFVTTLFIILEIYLPICKYYH